MTVSRVLKDDQQVTEETRERVLAAVRELGYRRNEVARNLRLGRATGMIGLLVTNLGNPFYARLALGVEEVAAGQGLGVVVSNTGEDAVRERELAGDLAVRRLDGLIVVPAGAGHRHLAPAALGGVPVVLASRPPAGVDLDTVLVDDFGGAQEATACLFADGHEKIGFLGNPPAVYTGAERFRGFWAAHEETGRTPGERWIRRGPTDIPSAEQAALDILREPDAPTALFCTNNRLTIGAYRAVKALDSDTALAGFDDFEMADMLDVPVTIVSYDPDEIGRRAARLLVQRIEQGEEGRRSSASRTVIPTTVVRYGPRGRTPSGER